jgi:hypothetical protein
MQHLRDSLQPGWCCGGVGWQDAEPGMHVRRDDVWPLKAPEAGMYNRASLLNWALDFTDLETWVAGARP